MSATDAELLNQSAELVDYHLFSSHSALVDALAREGVAQDHAGLVALGERLGNVIMFTLAALLGRGAGRDARYDHYRATLLADLADAADGELRARDLTQRIALAAQAALLLIHGPEPSCTAFLGSRIAAGSPAAFGTLPRSSDYDALTARVLAP